eukprot:Phypoly_transcript_24247.p1 GENE.Phypoly_transcript_24247~~Phypoly_transcript_24247.p1  ORF type:complete len:110 (+),score=3.91 Phypoly_transcript_24247:115-444(+)
MGGEFWQRTGEGCSPFNRWVTRWYSRIHGLAYHRSLPMDLFPLLSAMRPMLVVHSGKLTLCHDYLVKPSEVRYCRDLAELDKKWQVGPLYTERALKTWFSASSTRRSSW